MTYLDEYITEQLVKWQGRKIEVETLHSDSVSRLKVWTQDGLAIFELDDELNNGGRFILSETIPFTVKDPKEVAQKIVATSTYGKRSNHA